MDTILAFAELLLGFVPALAIVATVVIGLWAATKLFPRFGVMVVDLSDGLFGVDEEYDRKYKTGYQNPSNRWH